MSGVRTRRGAVPPAVALAALLLVVSGVLAGSGASSAAPAPRVTPVNADGPTGMDLTDAWSTYTTGDPNVMVAYVEGGINWHLSDAATLAAVVAVNWHATPVPCNGASVATATMVVGGLTRACATYYSTDESDYDPDGSGVVNAAQWQHDPRVHDANGNGVIDPEDLIAAFGHDGIDHTGLGYPDDISGWDFYDNQNDPATVDTAYTHANSQMGVIHHECPQCTILPVKAGDEALDPTDDLAKAWQFAADEGARVIVSVTADLGYSPFMRQVVDELHAKGVVVVEASNDFDSSDHQGGMFWPTVIPGNGAVATADGSSWIRSSLTSWGTHAMFTVPTHGGSTSESTPTTGGVIALLLSYGDKAYADHLIAHPLTGPEAVQVLRATAKPFTDTSLAWPGTPITPGAPDDWNEQYGYGMPDLYTAMQQIAAGTVNPVATIDAPDWYTTFDPTTATSITVTGSVTPSVPTDTVSWSLEMGLGGQPAQSSFETVATGVTTGPMSGPLGTVDLASIPSSFWDAPATLSTDRALSSTDQYAVTFRLVANENGNLGEDRRAVDVVHDGTLLAGFPEAVDPGSAGAGSAGPDGTDARASAEGTPQAADLQGDGHLDLIYGDTSGTVHAVDPLTGAELPGWPVHLPAVGHVVARAGIDPGDEPVITTVAVGDLDHDGRLSVVVVGLDGTVDVFDADGTVRPGWPQRMDLGVTPPAIPRPAMPNVRLPVTESTSSPVLADLGGTGGLDIVVAGGDGYLHAWRPDGTTVPGWPVKVALPASFTLHAGYTLEDDRRLVATPTVAWLQGSRSPPDIVERSQYTQITGPGVQPLPYSEVFAYTSTGRPLPGWPVTVLGLVEFYGSAQDAITEGSSSPVAADVTGDGADVVADSPIWSTPVEIAGDGSVVGTYGNESSALDSLASTLAAGGGSTTKCEDSPPPDVPVSFTSSGAFGIVGGRLAYAQSEVGSSGFGCLQYPNAGTVMKNYVAAYPAATAGGAGNTELPGFPHDRQGMGFLSSPVIADVTGSGQASVIEGGDSSSVIAVGAGGAVAPGFPKFTSGWDLYGTAAADLRSDGHTDIVTSTREGYVYAWATPGKASADIQWWSGRHDEDNSGNYGVDSRPPGILRSPRWAPPARAATFVAPGDNWYDGTVDHYVVTLAPSGRRVRVVPDGPAGTSQTIVGPPGTTGMRVQAVDAAGNVGPAATFGAAPPPSPADGGGYLVASGNGGVVAFGAAGNHGSLAARPAHGPVVAMAATPDGGGYWLVAADGGVFTFGDAAFYGSAAGMPLRAPIVGAAATPDGKGYWLVAADGGVFTFGDAAFHGSAAGTPLRAPVTGMAPTADGKGYWLVAADGGVFTFGDAAFHGSAAAVPGHAPVVGMAPTADGQGYWLAAADGGVFTYGDAGYHGSAVGRTSAPVVALAGPDDVG